MQQYLWALSIYPRASVLPLILKWSFLKGPIVHYPWWFNPSQLTGLTLSEPSFVDEFAKYSRITFTDKKSCIFCKICNFALLIVNAFLCTVWQYSNQREADQYNANRALFNTCGLCWNKIKIHLQFTKFSDFHLSL